MKNTDESVASVGNIRARFENAGNVESVAKKETPSTGVGNLKARFEKTEVKAAIPPKPKVNIAKQYKPVPAAKPLGHVSPRLVTKHGTKASNSVPPVKKEKPPISEKRQDLLSKLSPTATNNNIKPKPQNIPLNKSFGKETEKEVFDNVGGTRKIDIRSLTSKIETQLKGGACPPPTNADPVENGTGPTRHKTPPKPPSKPIPIQDKPLPQPVPLVAENRIEEIAAEEEDIYEEDFPPPPPTINPNSQNRPLPLPEQQDLDFPPSKNVPLPPLPPLLKRNTEQKERDNQFTEPRFENELLPKDVASLSGKLVLKAFQKPSGQPPRAPARNPEMVIKQVEVLGQDFQGYQDEGIIEDEVYDDIETPSALQPVPPSTFRPMTVIMPMTEEEEEEFEKSQGRIGRPPSDIYDETLDPGQFEGEDDVYEDF